MGQVRDVLPREVAQFLPQQDIGVENLHEAIPRNIHNFLEKYKEEVSESSLIMDDDENKEKGNPDPKANPKSE